MITPTASKGYAKQRHGERRKQQEQKSKDNADQGFNGQEPAEFHPEIPLCMESIVHKKHTAVNSYLIIIFYTLLISPASWIGKE